ncbi:MAG: pirin family protein [Limisphaerales bacterium]
MNTSAQATIRKRPADSRGRTELGWLHSRHSFSFGEYYDPEQMGFRSLRVMNEDIVEPGAGFGTHPHRDAEIFSYVIEGELQHQDSMGNGSVIKAGDLQYMSAGSGVRHSEFNPSGNRSVHFYQVWFRPQVSGGEPKYAERKLAGTAKPNSLTLLLSNSGREESIVIRQDAEIFFGKLETGNSLPFELHPERHAWIQVIKGSLKVLGETLRAGDGAAISDAASLDLSAENDSEFLLFDLS